MHTIAPDPREPGREIGSALSGFLGQGALSSLIVAEKGGTVPQPMAQLVHFPRLCITLSGQERMWLEQGGRARLTRQRRGDAVLIPANCWNRPTPESKALSLNLLFGARQIGLSLVSASGPGAGRHRVVKATLPEPAEEVARHLLQAMLRLRPEHAAAAPSLLRALLEVCSTSLLHPPATPGRRSTGLYDSICMYIQENLQLPLSRSSVARHFRKSPNHLSRLFSTEGQVGFNEYVNFVRLNRAKYLLRHHRQSLDEIASSCGYADTSYFCRVFKRKTRLTPSAYRSAHHSVAHAPA